MERGKVLCLPVGLILLLAGCGRPPLPAEQGEIAATQVAAANPTTVALVESKGALVAARTDPDQCLECHSDKDRLIETAKVEQEAPDESSGVG